MTELRCRPLLTMPSGVIHNIVVNDFAMAEVELCARVFRLNAATGLFGSDKEVLECCIVLLDKRSEVGVRTRSAAAVMGSVVG